MGLIMANDSKKPSIHLDSILEEKTISNPDAIPILFHAQKQQVLKLLMEKPMTIIDIKNKIDLNPGTIKRHIDDLVQYELAIPSHTEINEYGITMKYYRASARKYIISIRWP
jgi:hypothetical protein